MKKLILPAVAIAIAFSASAFTTVKKVNSDFYVYSGSTSKSDIQNANNYAASTSDPCSGTNNVCGVTLTTAKPAGQHPVASEFSAEETNLWSSQENHSAADGSIVMKP